MTDVVETLMRERLLAIVRSADAATARATAEALHRRGIAILEISLTTPGALEAIAATREAVGESAVVGAGTVMDAALARSAIEAGAQFVISPHLSGAVAAVCRDASVPYIPGAMTPTEIVRAADEGCGVVKVFPAAVLGPRYVKDVLAPVPDLKLVPTGGVDDTNARAFLEAGAAAVAVGGALCAEDVIGDPDRLAAVVGRLREAVCPRNEGATNDVR